MLINPKIPKHFFDRANDERSNRELNKFWQVPIILTEEYSENDTWADYQKRTAGNTADYVAKTEDEFNNQVQESKESWFKHFPTGTAYRVYCLDGGAWDRPTEWGSFGTLEEAKECCMTGPRWLNRSVVKNEAA
jgi:hypothetical protein